MPSKDSLVIAGAIIIEALIYANFNPYQACKRDVKLTYPKLSKKLIANYTKDNC